MLEVTSVSGKRSPSGLGGCEFAWWQIVRIKRYPPSVVEAYSVNEPLIKLT
jgi:hypothetical protein